MELHEIKFQYDTDEQQLSSVTYFLGTRASAKEHMDRNGMEQLHASIEEILDGHFNKIPGIQKKRKHGITDRQETITANYDIDFRKTISEVHPMHLNATAITETPGSMKRFSVESYVGISILNQSTVIDEIHSSIMKFTTVTDKEVQDKLARLDDIRKTYTR